MNPYPCSVDFKNTPTNEGTPLLLGYFWIFIAAEAVWGQAALLRVHIAAQSRAQIRDKGQRDHDHMSDL